MEGEAMRKSVRRAIRDEKGAALALVLVLLVVGGLILTPLLGLMTTGLMSGQVYEKKTAELYAADAGVEDAVWRIQADNLRFGTNNWSDPWHLTVNGKNVTVQVRREDMDTTCAANFSYQVLSTAATSDGSGTAAIASTTTVDARIEPLVFDLLSGALVSSGNIGFHKDCTVTGDVYYVGEITGKDYTHTEGEELRISPDVFPTQEEIESFADDLKAQAMAGGTHNGTMTINSNTSLNSTYIAGDLYLAAGVMLTINGVVYVTGDVSVKKEVDDYNLEGSGSLVAEHDIDLRKASGFGAAGDSIIMSVYGAINFKKGGTVEALIYAPNGTITFDKDMTVAGSVIGAGIQTDKDGAFAYVSKGSSFEFFDPVTVGTKIMTYTINP
jgi:Tfp pilus assembly protein PilX